MEMKVEWLGQKKKLKGAGSLSLFLSLSLYSFPLYLFPYSPPSPSAVRYSAPPALSLSAPLLQPEPLPKVRMPMMSRAVIAGLREKLTTGKASERSRICSEATRQRQGLLEHDARSILLCWVVLSWTCMPSVVLFTMQKLS